MTSTEIRHNVAQNRFEILLDGTQAGVLDYHLDGTVYDLVHTGVDPQFGGKGVGTQLVLGALREIQELGGSVIPSCPFIPKVISEHVEFAPLVTGPARARFGLA